MALEGSPTADMPTLVVVDVHLEHLLAAHLLGDMGTRELEGLAVTLHPVSAVEGVDAHDAELAGRSLPREGLVDAGVTTLADRSRIVGH